MTTLDKLIELNKLQKQNRKNRLEDKLKQEYYGYIEELFDPLTETLNANSETSLAHNAQNSALAEQTLKAIDWQNLLDKLWQSLKLVPRSMKTLRGSTSH